jgi:hypothetical protein
VKIFGCIILFLGSRERIAGIRMLRITGEDIHPIQKRAIQTQVGGTGGERGRWRWINLSRVWLVRLNKMQNKRSLWRNYFPPSIFFYVK